MYIKQHIKLHTLSVLLGSSSMSAFQSRISWHQKLFSNTFWFAGIGGLSFPGYLKGKYIFNHHSFSNNLYSSRHRVGMCTLSNTPMRYPANRSHGNSVYLSQILSINVFKFTL